MTSQTKHKPSYNHIWAIGYAYALNTGMNVHRAEQFAADYAQFHDGQWMTEIAHPADFVSFAVALDYHYHG